MAYMRGDYYLWDDASGLHLWAKDSYDSWDEARWHRNEEGEIVEHHLKDGQNMASGVSIHQDIADEYVMMRLAQMLYEGVAEAAIDRVVGLHDGNIGCRMLKKNAARLKEVLRQITMEDAEPYVWQHDENGHVMLE